MSGEGAPGGARASSSPLGGRGAEWERGGWGGGRTGGDEEAALAVLEQGEEAAAQRAERRRAELPRGVVGLCERKSAEGGLGLEEDRQAGRERISKKSGRRAAPPILKAGAGGGPQTQAARAARSWVAPHQDEGGGGPCQSLKEEDGNVNGRRRGARRRREDGQDNEESGAAELREEGLRAGRAWHRVSASASRHCRRLGRQDVSSQMPGSDDPAPSPRHTMCVTQ